MTGELTKAHCQFLLQIGKIEEKGVNPFHKSNYATLEGVLSVVNPVLAANGLSVNQVFDYLENGRTVLKTHLRHVSGEEIISSVLFPESPANKNKLHDFGGNCTYCRRYALLAILGICAGIEDTDGNHAQEGIEQIEARGWVKAGPGTLEYQEAISVREQERDWRANPSTSPDTHTQPKQEIPKALNADEQSSIIEDLRALHGCSTKRFSTFSDAYRKQFPDCQEKISDHIQEPKHADFVQDWFIKNGPPSP